MPVSYGNPGRKLESLVATPVEGLEKAEEGKVEEKITEVLAINTKEGEIREWTAADDALLIDMKNQEISWKEIGALFKGKEPSMKKRYKQLVKETANGEAIAKEGQGKEEAKEEKEDAAKAKNGKGKAKDEEKGTNSNERPVISGDESGDLTVNEIVMFYRLEKHCNQKKWQSIVSRFYEWTGKRLTMEQLQTLMEKKAAAADV